MDSVWVGVLIVRWSDVLWGCEWLWVGVIIGLEYCVLGLYWGIWFDF